MTDVYIVTATTEEATFNWVYTNRKDAEELQELGLDLGGYVHWECYAYTMDTPPLVALAGFKDLAEIHEEDCPAIDGFGCRCGEDIASTGE